MINYGGTGLDLAISKELTTLLGGKFNTIQVKKALIHRRNSILNVTKKHQQQLLKKKAL